MSRAQDAEILTRYTVTVWRYVQLLSCLLFLRTVRGMNCAALLVVFPSLVTPVLGSVQSTVVNVKFGKVYLNFGLLMFHVMLAAVR